MAHNFLLDTCKRRGTRKKSTIEKMIRGEKNKLNLVKTAALR